MLLDIPFIQSAKAWHINEATNTNANRVTREHALSFRYPRKSKQAADSDSIALNNTQIPPYQLSIKTNLLMDAMLLPCLGAELSLKNNWSVAAEWHFAWWKNDPSNLYWQSYGGDLALRRWFSTYDRPFTGHHFGIYAQMLTYDFELGNKGNLADKWTLGGGLEYGFSMPLSRHLNLDFSIGLGFIAGEYKEYLPQDGHYVWQATKQRRWLGPTKAEISLVWILGDVFHRGKGVAP